MTISKTTANILEGIGLLLVLGSFLIQLLESEIEANLKEAQHYETQAKLDALWSILVKEYSTAHPEIGVQMAIDFKVMDKNWKYYSQNRQELQQWKKGVLAHPTSAARILIFILGSLLLIFPKFVKIHE
jgi:hypothetical protein